MINIDLNIPDNHAFIEGQKYLFGPFLFEDFAAKISTTKIFLAISLT